MSFAQTVADASAQANAIHNKLMEGRAKVPVFAEAIGKTPRTVYAYIAQGMPIEYVGRIPVVVIEPAIAWLRAIKKKPQRVPPRRGRPRNTAAT